MPPQTHISFQAPTLNNDGTPITEALSYTLLIDTVSPPVTSYAVPAANVAAAVAGLITVKFTDIPAFVPRGGVHYNVEVVAYDTDGKSAASAAFAFVYDLAPQAPTGLTVG